ncbi:hypothetical protein Q3G72_029879 [Acer saccharum]|nr:hypothetical protein Q3G72_029879 [Acer saccharum]
MHLNHSDPSEFQEHVIKLCVDLHFLLISSPRKPGAPGQRRSRSETPLLKWKVEDRERSRKVSAEEEKEEAVEGAGQCRRWRQREFRSVRVSAWCKECGSPVSCPSWWQRRRAFGSEPRDPLQSPGSSVSGMKSGYLCKVSAVSMVAVLEANLEQARARIQELETDRCSSKKKLEHFLRKVSEESVAWRSREHEKISMLLLMTSKQSVTERGKIAKG